MKEGAPYPKSGPYRENKEVIAANAEDIAFKARKEMFYRQPYPHQVEDVDNFIEYASQRLSAGAIHSPLKPIHSWGNEAEDKFRNLTNLPGHDHWHAAVRYKMSGGKSLVPPHMKTETEFEQYTSSEGLIEEGMVDLLQGGSASETIFEGMRANLKSHQSYEALLNREPDSKTKAALDEIDSLRETNQIDYFTKLHLFLVTAISERIARDKAPGGHKKTETVSMPAFYAVRNEVLENPDANYLELARDRYEAVLGENPNPDFQLDEFEKMLSPLLQRLKLKKMIAQLESQS